LLRFRPWREEEGEGWREEGEEGGGGGRCSMIGEREKEWENEEGRERGIRRKVGR
jgi:hypothetical protein